MPMKRVYAAAGPGSQHRGMAVEVRNYPGLLYLLHACVSQCHSSSHGTRADATGAYSCAWYGVSAAWFGKVVLRRFHNEAGNLPLYS